MALLKVYDGSSWVTAEGKVYDGSIWKPKQKFYDGSSWVDLFASGAGSETTTVTVGQYITKGLSLYGYYSVTGTGSVSPSTIGGNTILSLYDSTNFNNFLFRLGAASLGASYFTKLTVQDDGVPNYIDLTSASATYATDGSSYSQWSWQSGPVDWSGDLAANRTVEVVW